MAYYELLYGLLTIVGGVIGFLTAHSKMSLISGGISGLLIIVSAVIYMRGNNIGFYALVALSLLLAIFFGVRFSKSLAFMPAGLMVLLSVISLIGLFIKRPGPTS
jgi:uncharacterized membrane protein (UPF0136 family)